jgi:hypothetical protein
LRYWEYWLNEIEPQLTVDEVVIDRVDVISGETLTDEDIKGAEPREGRPCTALSK